MSDTLSRSTKCTHSAIQQDESRNVSWKKFKLKLNDQIKIEYVKST